MIGTTYNTKEIAAAWGLTQGGVLSELRSGALKGYQSGGRWYIGELSAEALYGAQPVRAIYYNGITGQMVRVDNLYGSQTRHLREMYDAENTEKLYFEWRAGFEYQNLSRLKGEDAEYLQALFDDAATCADVAVSNAVQAAVIAAL